jgi:hypothetical protein
MAAGLNSHLGNAAPHGSGAHDANGRENRLHMKVLFLEGLRQVMTKCFNLGKKEF